MKLKPDRTPEQETALAEAAVVRFLFTAREPAILESGAELLPITPATCLVERRAGGLFVQAWSDTATLTRRIRAVSKERPGRLELLVERFPRRKSTLLFLDRVMPAAQPAEKQASRHAFREEVRCLIAHQFPQWTIASLSAAADLERSLSPVYPRAFLRQGNQGLAVLASPSGEGAAALTFALLWLDHLRNREPRLAIQGPVLFLAEGDAAVTAHRLPFLDREKVSPALYIYRPDGLSDWLDPGDVGNVETALPIRRQAWQPGELAHWLPAIGGHPDVQVVSLGNGEASLRVRGLEFARTSSGRLLFGLPPRYPASPCHLPEIVQLAQQISRIRHPQASDTQNPLYRASPELWLESSVRDHLCELDPRLAPEPLYGQVPVISGVERGIVDLLGIDTSGRLAVIELKVTQDPHLPLQALDYWLRVKWHLDRGEFAANGYFPQLQHDPCPPRLFLVAPALEFHPGCETVLSFLHPSIQVERIGLGVEWRKRFQVLFRISVSSGCLAGPHPGDSQKDPYVPTRR